uniref:OBP21 n=1 Tax=Holotrichia parallela TaxID=93412 RepID=A0A0G2YIU4_HOLPA|nr:OBP21 [Holotrichia parallela]
MHRFVILLVCLIGADAGTKLHDLFVSETNRFLSQCLSESSADQAEFDKLISHKIPTTREGMCLITCFQQKLGVQNANGTMNKEGIFTFIESLKPDSSYNQIKDVLIGCLTTGASVDDKCAAGSKYYECAINIGEKKGIL